MAILNQVKNADNFIRYTSRMAEDLDSNLHLTYILNPVSYPVSPGATGVPAQAVEINLEVERKHAKEKLEEKLISLRKNLSSDINIDYSIDIGPPHIVVNKFITDHKVHMVVLEGKDERSFWNFNVTNMEIIQKVKCPGWIIPSGVTYEKYNKIIYATDYNEADIKNIKELIGLTRRFSPEIIALHVTGSKDFEEKAMRYGFKEMLIKETEYDKISINTIIDKENGNLGEIINDFALGKNAKLIVLLKENQGFLERIFKSSATKEILEESQLPVLIYHEKK